MSDFDKVIRGTLVSGDGITPGGYVAIRDGLIAVLGEGRGREAAEAENFVSSTRAAAAGGVTTLVDMPHDASKLIATPVPIARPLAANVAAAV